MKFKFFKQTATFYINSRVMLTGSVWSGSKEDWGHNSTTSRMFTSSYHTIWSRKQPVRCKTK